MATSDPGLTPWAMLKAFSLISLVSVAFSVSVDLQSTLLERDYKSRIIYTLDYKSKVTEAIKAESLLIAQGVSPGSNMKSRNGALKVRHQNPIVSLLQSLFSGVTYLNLGLTP